MNREQMIAWLTLEGWVPSVGRAVYKDRTEVFVNGYSRTYEVLHITGISASDSAPRGWTGKDSHSLHKMMTYIQKNNL